LTIRIFLVLSVAIGCTAGCGASVRTMDVSQVPNFTVASINAAPRETLGNLMTTGSKAFVVLLKSGEKVPVNLRASFGPIALQAGQDYLVFAQDTYLYIGPAGMLLSPDGKQWAAVQDAAALNKIFGLKTGTFQIGFGAPKDQPVAFTIVLERK
jgi:hypothetical protein